MKRNSKLLSIMAVATLMLIATINASYGQSKGRLLVPQNYSTIQAGINAAGIGDTVLVSTGVYNENINFNGKPVMVASQYLLSGDSTDIIQTIIDGNQIGPVVTFENRETENSLLVGFTLRDGLATAGGGIFCVNADPVISNLIIKNCEAEYGGGIYLAESNAYIWRVACTGNHADYYGGAINCDYYSYPAIYTVRLIGNSAQVGGGIYCYLSDPYIAYFHITDNVANYGAGIYLYASSPYIWDGIINGNAATNYGGGIECDYYSYPILHYLQINTNTSVYGGGVHLSFSDVKIINSTIVSNSSDYGGGIYCYYSSPTVQNTVVAYNLGEYGLNVYEGTPVIMYSDFYNNELGNFYNVDEAIGVNVQKNINNDSCDVFFNLQRDPVFVGLASENFHIQATSKCIDAGDPDSPEDPDFSVTDIGMYYFPQTFVANFSADQTYGLPPLTVQFVDESIGNPNQWFWDFNGDGIIESTLKNPQWTYTEMGDYTVILQTARGFSSDKRIKNNYIKVFYIPQPSIIEIADAPDDQGGWVMVKFLRSVYDTDTLADRGTESYTVQYYYQNSWVSGNSGAAYGVDNYTILCHTPFDSTSQSSGVIDFRIIASMDEGNFVSATMAGFSVDNLSPQVPDQLDIQIFDDHFSLSWENVPDPDLKYYAIYKTAFDGLFGEEPDFYTTEPLLANIEIGGEQEIYAVKAIDFSGNASALSEPVEAPLRMSIQLNSGWNSLSGFVSPYNLNIQAMFSGIVSEVIYLNNLKGFWYPDENQNTLVNWDSHSGYQLKLSGDASLAITGFYEKDRSIILKSGWNLIPVLSGCPVSVSEITDILGTKVIVIKDAVGFGVAWPSQQISTIQQLIPGKAYLIKMNEGVTLVFPQCE